MSAFNTRYSGTRGEDHVQNLQKEGQIALRLKQNARS